MVGKEHQISGGKERQFLSIFCVQVANITYIYLPTNKCI